LPGSVAVPQHSSAEQSGLLPATFEQSFPTVPFGLAAAVISARSFFFYSAYALSSVALS